MLIVCSCGKVGKPDDFKIFDDIIICNYCGESDLIFVKKEKKKRKGKKKKREEKNNELQLPLF